MLRRTALALAASAAALLGAVPLAAQAHSGPGGPVLPSVGVPGLGAGPGFGAGQDRLTVSVRDAGAGDGTFVLRCRPAGGDHPDVQGACGRLAELAAGGQDPFAPVPRDAMCTMQHGGDATARVEGTWRGRAVDASFARTDGCRIARWDRLVPVLPSTGS
ncbi:MULTISPECIES: subtilase-type protease inhibitor [Streptomyces]|uniref:subtilase-type protease inhibitor n=1 Tax=Streptomyces TaxID=1883 RepID=UPI002148BC7B|nr:MULTISPECIES: subtilase-type protease inhibitor [Streptomyces]MCR0989602.1 subtilase-type protease inhibitor [Streptomyces albidoflavus]UYX95058.1 subtilase-type protease inhibitor [Streptomyces sp. BI87]